MQRRTRWIAGGAVALAVIGAGTGIAIANGAGSDDSPITGSALQRATKAALAETGGGSIVETEVGDGAAAYGVEVRLDDGSTVEVALDRDFRVIRRSADEDGPNDRDAEGGD